MVVSLSINEKDKKGLAAIAWVKQISLDNGEPLARTIRNILVSAKEAKDGSNSRD